MDKTEYIKRIRDVIESAGGDADKLIITIEAIASALMTRDLADREIESLDTVTVLEETRYGQKLAPHPAFKVQKDAQQTLNALFKSAGITAGELAKVVSDDEDPDTLLAERMANA